MSNSEVVGNILKAILGMLVLLTATLLFVNIYFFKHLYLLSN